MKGVLVVDVMRVVFVVLVEMVVEGVVDCGNCIVEIVLYLNDLAFSFDNVSSDPFVLPNDTRLNSLVYADDLIILS